MYESLCTQLAHEADSAHSKDVRVASFSRALLTLISQDEHHQLLEPLQERQEQSIPSSATRLVLRALQKQLMLRDYRYPIHFDNETAWLDAIHRLQDEPSSFEIFRHDLANRQLQSNVVERYKAFKLTLSLLQPRTGSSPRILDVGCSRNHGLKKLKLNLPFRPIECGALEPEYPGTLLNTAFNSLVRAPLPMGRSVGTDIVPITYGDDAAWARSCSFYPNELMDPAAVSEYDFLENINPENLFFKLGDFSNTGIIEEEPEDKFDAVIASTFLYQLPAEKRTKARDIFRQYLSRQGLIIYQDFVGDIKDEHQLDIKDDWTQPYSYRTLVEFADPADGRLYEFFRWDYGRCNAWRAGADIDEVLQNNSNLQKNTFRTLCD